jgi:hypothetical protein
MFLSSGNTYCVGPSRYELVPIQTVVVNQPTRKLTKDGALHNSRTSSLARLGHFCIQNVLLQMVNGAL